MPQHLTQDRCLPPQGSREQLAIAEFANSLLIIPKTLASNAAKDSSDLVARLRAYHAGAQACAPNDPRKALRFYGLDLLEGTLRDNLKAGVLEPTMSKVKSFKAALEACTALLRIDDAIEVPKVCVVGQLKAHFAYPSNVRTRNRKVCQLMTENRTL